MPSTELIDILLPQDPGFDWLFWLERLLEGLAGLGVLAILIWWLKNLWLPLRLMLQYRILVWRQQRLALPKLLMQCQAWRQASLPFWQTQTDYAQTDFKAFGLALDQACYGAQKVGTEVSRETLMDLLGAAAQQAWDLALADKRLYWRKQWQAIKQGFTAQSGDQHD